MVRALRACLVALGLLLAPGARAARVHRRHGTPAVHHRAALRGASVESIPMSMYKQDCFKKRPVFLSTGVHVNVSADMFPGAGMEPKGIVPFQTVLKDGFYHVDCVKDYMYYFGDKFGDHKWDYKLGQVSNVSIVLYDSHVSKQEREPMSHKVCFAFCRTVPDMVFFGITNGRSCYCMPYMKPMEGDSSQCASVCEGDTATTCGGETKSAIFEMHMCQQAAENLDSSGADMEDIGEIMGTVMEKFGFIAKDMKESGEKLQAQYGQVGDQAASALAQAAKVHAGKLQQAVDESIKVAQDMGSIQERAALLKPKIPAAGAAMNFKDAQEAEDLTEAMQEATAKADLQAQVMSKMLYEANPDLIESDPVDDLFKPVMYFVNKAYVDVPATCGGASLASPMVGTMEGCAKACEHQFQKCAGFTWFENHLCFLFSEMKSVTYYTGCPAKDEVAKCMVKFSKFSGTTLEPDPSGKCKGCLTSATEAARCPA